MFHKMEGQDVPQLLGTNNTSRIGSSDDVCKNITVGELIAIKLSESTPLVFDPSHEKNRLIIAIGEILTNHRSGMILDSASIEKLKKKIPNITFSRGIKQKDSRRTEWNNSVIRMNLDRVNILKSVGEARPDKTKRPWLREVLGNPDLRREFLPRNNKRGRIEPNVPQNISPIDKPAVYDKKRVNCSTFYTQTSGHFVDCLSSMDEIISEPQSSYNEMPVIVVLDENECSSEQTLSHCQHTIRSSDDAREPRVEAGFKCLAGTMIGSVPVSIALETEITTSDSSLHQDELVAPHKETYIHSDDDNYQDLMKQNQKLLHQLNEKHEEFEQMKKELNTERERFVKEITEMRGSCEDDMKTVSDHNINLMLKLVEKCTPHVNEISSLKKQLEQQNLEFNYRENIRSNLITVSETRCAELNKQLIKKSDEFNTISGLFMTVMQNGFFKKDGRNIELERTLKEKLSSFSRLSKDKKLRGSLRIAHDFATSSDSSVQLYVDYIKQTKKQTIFIDVVSVGREPQPCTANQHQSSLLLIDGKKLVNVAQKFLDFGYDIRLAAPFRFTRDGHAKGSWSHKSDLDYFVARHVERVRLINSDESIRGGVNYGHLISQAMRDFGVVISNDVFTDIIVDSHVSVLSYLVDNLYHVKQSFATDCELERFGDKSTAKLHSGSFIMQLDKYVEFFIQTRMGWKSENVIRDYIRFPVSITRNN